MRLSAAIIAVALAVLTIARAHEPPRKAIEQGCARYLGNEGVLISSGDHKVLIDAFYADSYGTYLLVPEGMRDAMMAGAPPFDGVDAILFSHIHGDHFSAEPTLAYLRAHPEVDVFASGQVIDALVAAGAPRDDRLVRFDLDAEDAARSAQVGPIAIEAVRIPHAGGARRAAIENLAFRVSLDGALVALHLGDADPADRHFAPHQDHWDARALDVAFPPYWFFDSPAGRRIVQERLRPKQAVGVHVPAAAAGMGDAWRAKYRADLFTDPGESRSIKGADCAGLAQ